MSANRTETRKIELVETDNIARALARLREHGGDLRMRRALYHAFCMEGPNEWELRQKIREVLHLP